MSDQITRLPAAPSGGVRRAIPAPFQRPRINLDGGREAKRNWALIPAHQLKVGDLIPDIGRLYRVDEVALVPPPDSGLSPQEIADAVTWTITVHGGLNNTRTYQGGEPVYCFSVEAG